MARKGLVIVYTGHGKGKTTAALGLAMRASGHGLRVLMVEFIKSGERYGEHIAAEKLDSNFEIVSLGKGYVGIPTDKRPREEHERAAANALEYAETRMNSGDYDMVILDEINIAIHLGLLDVERVLSLIRNRPLHVHLVLTGRDAPKEIIDEADLVTEMKLIKHPFDKGVKAQKGIEF